jgi:glucan biosynthesis protein C
MSSILQQPELEVIMKNPARNVRLFYLDWIRVLSILGVFLFHNARFFDQFGDWHVKNATTNIAASAWVAFMAQWIMPLFFVIAGAGTFYALESRRASQFARERILRLLVPLIFGMLVIVVPQAYFQAVSHGQPFGGSNPFQVYVEYVKTLPQGNAFHLWFLDDLFIFSIIALPILVPLKGGRSVISRLASFFNNSWALTTILVSCLAAVDVFLFPGGFLGSTSSGGWNFVAYALFFVSGYLIFANMRIMESIRKSAWILLSVGIAAMV